MIYGTRLGLVVSFIAMGWLTGCGPKPVALYVEPPEPMKPIEAVEPVATAETVEHSKGTTDRIVDLPQAASGSATTASSRATEAAVPPFIHKVRWGHETLFTIALWYTGRGNNWRRLATENPQIKPRRMRIGATIRIPDSLLIRRRPMPEEYQKPAPIRKPGPVKKKSSNPKPVEKNQTPPVQRPVDQTPALYGPVGDAPQVPVEDKDELLVPLETIDE